MIWIILGIIAIIGTPVLMFAIASLAVEIGFVALFTVAFGLMALFAVLSIPAATITAVTVGSIWLVFKLISNVLGE